jgi:hypothetical protein
MTTATFTRQQIEDIKVGKTRIAWGLGDGQYGEPTPVVEIHAKQEDCKGKLFVCGYRRFGSDQPFSAISFSIKEGDALDYRLYQIHNG